MLRRAWRWAEVSKSCRYTSMCHIYIYIYVYLDWRCRKLVKVNTGAIEFRRPWFPRVYAKLRLENGCRQWSFSSREHYRSSLCQRDARTRKRSDLRNTFYLFFFFFETTRIQMMLPPYGTTVCMLHSDSRASVRECREIERALCYYFYLLWTGVGHERTCSVSGAGCTSACLV